MTKTIVVAALCSLGFLPMSSAKPIHRHLRRVRPPAALAATPTGGPTAPVPGGVPGDLPFNNQLRKFSDPLGANGSK